MDRKVILVGAGALALAVAAAISLLRAPSAGDAEAADGPASDGRRAGKASMRGGDEKRARPKRVAQARPKARGAASKAAPPEGAEGGEPAASEFPAEDQRRLDAIQDALDGERFDDVKRLAEALADHPAAEVRQRAVEALQWFGEKSLASLTPFLADSDADVRDSAMTAVEQSLSEMEDEGAKLAYIESLFQIKDACSEDGLTMLAGQLNGFSDQIAVVDAAVRVIEANRNPAAAKEMREVYEFVTGEEYAGKDAAEAWKAEKAAEQ